VPNKWLAVQGTYPGWRAQVSCATRVLTARKEVAGKMDYAKLNKFVRSHGNVKIFSSGKERKLVSGDFDTVDLVEKAEKFEYDGRSYTKAEMEELVDDAQ
jgi:hypothetical protein